MCHAKYFIASPALSLTVRRVHITEATLKHLNKAYEVEEGNGHLRDPYLKELNVLTYLVIDPRVSSLSILLENAHSEGEWKHLLLQIFADMMIIYIKRKIIWIM